MKYSSCFAILFFAILKVTTQEEVRLIELEPQDAKQIIDQQDTSLKYAPKIESNVPAVRYLGNEPHQVSEDIYLANQYHGQDGLGGYLYGYSVPDIAKTEKKEAGGDLRGAYNYIAGNGQEIKVEYWDDGTGFHQVDNVPKTLPEDLPEVKKAKEDFMRIWQEQAERNSHPVEDPYNSEGQYKEGPLSVQGQLHRQQQFAAQFGKTSGYQQPGGYQTSASQQNSVYQSNLERAPQTYNPSYQPYQGRDQQNQGAYQAKQYSSAAKGPQSGGSPIQGSGASNQGQIRGGFGSAGTQGGIGYGAQKSSVLGFAQGGQTAFGQGIQGGQPAYGQGSQGAATGTQGFQGWSGSIGAQGQGQKSQGSPGFGSTGYGSQGNQGSWNQPGSKSSSQGYQGGQVGYGAQGNQGTWNQPGQKSNSQGSQGAYQTHYQGQPSQNVNKYATQPQGNAYGSQSGYSGQSQGRNTPSAQGQEDDDGQYRETDEGQYNEKDDEQQGPPKGFFYKFDYPVGIIVSKGAPAQGGQHAGGYQPQGGQYGNQPEEKSARVY